MKHIARWACFSFLSFFIVLLVSCGGDSGDSEDGDAIIEDKKNKDGDPNLLLIYLHPRAEEQIKSWVSRAK